MTIVDSFERPRVRDSMRALRLSAVGGALSTRDVVAIIAKGTWARVCFVVLMAVTARSALPLTLIAFWAGFMLAWELTLRPMLDRTVAVALAQRSEPSGVWALVAINFFGACAYCLFPVAAWLAPGEIGKVFATAWLCGCATHAFVYFSSHRALLLSVIAPVAACAIAAPFASGINPISAAAAVTLVSMVAAAGMFGRDREMLLAMISKHAAARARAEKENTAKSQFLATMSHELRTPLNAIIGYAELIEEDAKDTASADAGKIRASARQLLGVINVILDVSKLEAGEVTLRPERTPVAEVLEHVREAAVPLAAANANSFILVEDARLGEIDVDHVRLYQCLMQLVSNAAKFTRGGEIRLSAARTETAGRPIVRFDVADTGIGIPPDQQERVFEPFVQVETNSSRRYEGAGLGLSFVRRIARIMGGGVSCVSTPGEGSTFTLWITG